MKNKKTIYIIVVVVLISIIGVLGYLYLNEKNKNVGGNKNDNSNSKQEEVFVSEYFDKETEYLYGMIPTHFIEYNIYQDKMLTSKDVPMDALFLKVYYELIENYDEEIVASVGDLEDAPDSDDYNSAEAYKKAYKKKCLETGNLYADEACYIVDRYEDKDYYRYGWDAYKEETVKKIFEEFYGKEVEYKALEEIGTGAAGCSYSDGYYFCSVGGGYGYGFEASNESFFVKVETTRDEKYIYAKYLRFKFVCKDGTEYCDDQYIEIYIDEAETNKIGEEKYFYYDEEYDKELFYYTDEELFEKYGDQAVLYKHTYKKNDDGSYYWYSVEPVK